MRALKRPAISGRNGYYKFINQELCATDRLILGVISFHEVFIRQEKGKGFLPEEEYFSKEVHELVEIVYQTAQVVVK